MKKTVVTVVGKDSVGIIAKVCTYLANNTINILDISQTIVGGFFNMMMIVDLEDCAKEFGVVVDELEKKWAVLSRHSVKIFLTKCIVFNDRNGGYYD